MFRPRYPWREIRGDSGFTTTPCPLHISPRRHNSYLKPDIRAVCMDPTRRQPGVLPPNPGKPGRLDPGGFWDTEGCRVHWDFRVPGSGVCMVERKIETMPSWLSRWLKTIREVGQVPSAPVAQHESGFWKKPANEALQNCES